MLGIMAGAVEDAAIANALARSIDFERVNLFLPDLADCRMCSSRRAVFAHSSRLWPGVTVGTRLNGAAHTVRRLAPNSRRFISLGASSLAG